MASGSEENKAVDSGSGSRRKGHCKWFNVAKGWGFITPDDGGQDVFVHQSTIQMSGFRSLGDDEEIEFEAKDCEKGQEATVVTAIGGGDCKGSTRRPVSKKKSRKVRCYNCGEFANHIAAKCSLGPQPKRCHNCKSDDHLIADCPKREVKQTSTSNGSSQSSEKLSCSSPNLELGTKNNNEIQKETFDDNNKDIQLNDDKENDNVMSNNNHNIKQMSPSTSSNGKITQSCFNCGEFANHITAKCLLGPQPKICHSCKSDYHLIVDCPKWEAKQSSTSNGIRQSESDNSKSKIKENMSTSENCHVLVLTLI